MDSNASFIDASVLRTLATGHEKCREAGFGFALQYGTTRVVRRILEITDFLERRQSPHRRPFTWVLRACCRSSSKACRSSTVWRSIRMLFARSMSARRPNAPSRL